MKKTVIVLIVLACAVGLAYAKTGFDFSMGFGSGAATVGGPVTPTGHFLLIDGSNHYLLIDNATNKLRIDGAS